MPKTKSIRKLGNLSAAFFIPLSAGKLIAPFRTGYGWSINARTDKVGIYLCLAIRAS
jgi:hypothetical protein